MSEEEKQNLEDQENEAPDYTPLADTTPEEAESRGFQYRTDKERKEGLRARTRRQFKLWKVLVGGGVVASMIGGVVAFFLALLPLKLEFITQNIIEQVSTVPEYAVDRRVDYLAGRYITRQVIGANIGDDVFIGNTLAGTLFGNWRAANFERDILDKYGFTFETNDRGPGGNTTSWTLRKDGVPIAFADGGDVDLSSREVRSVFRTILNDETKKHQVLKRKTIRKILRNKYDVPFWYVDIFGERNAERADNIRTSYINKKRSFYKWTINQTIGRLSTRYAAYFGCLVGGGNDCKKIRDGDIDRRSDPIQTDDLADEAGTPEGREGSENYRKRLTELINKVGVKRLIASVAGGIGIANFLSDIVDAIENERLTEVTYYVNKDAAAGAATAFMVAKDQLNAGDIVGEDASVLFERLDEFEESPVAQALLNPGTSSLATTAYAQGGIERPCNVNGELKTIPLDPGELACPDMHLYQPRIDQEIKNMDGWDLIADIGGAWKQTIGGVFDALADFISSIPIIESTVNAFLSITNLDDVIGAGTEAVMSRVFSPGCTGAEEDALAFDCWYAGMDVQYNEIAESGGDLGIGGQLLTDEQVVAIHDEVEQERQEEFQSQTLFARLFSENSRSLLGRVALALPANLGQAVKTIASSIAQPFQFLGAIFGSSAQAQSLPTNFNPFHKLTFGYPVDSPAFETALDDPELAECATDLEDKREFGTTPEIGFEVPLTTDLCALERVATNVASAVYTNDDDGGLGGAQTIQQQPGVPNTGYQCPSNLGEANSLGYHYLPEPQGGIYTISTSTGVHERWGSKELICVLYTVAQRWEAAYPDSTFWIGDLNSGAPHVSHNEGHAVDVLAIGNPRAGDHTNGGYDTQATIDLGKFFVDTGVIENIWWCEPGDGSTAAIREYAESRGTPVNIRCIDGHANHFHVDTTTEPLPVWIPAPGTVF